MAEDEAFLAKSEFYFTDPGCPIAVRRVAAANAALNSFNKVLLANHIRTCVADDIRDGKEETIDELVTVLQKLMK